MKEREHQKALTGVLVCQAAALLLYHALAGGTLLDPNPYNSYALQAQNWLQGRCCIADGASYPWLELAVFQGKYYQSFPPVPAVLMLPWLVVCGSWDAVPSNLLQALMALLLAAGVYACFWRQGARPVTAAFFAVFVSMGSNVFLLSGSGGVWFVAQVAGLCFTVWGLFFALGDTPAGRMLASLCFGCAVGCRPFYALLGLLWGMGLLWDLFRKRRTLPEVLQAALPAACIAACMLAYNFARFGSVLEFGHTYLPEFQRAEYGQFSWHYLWPNLCKLLRPVVLDDRMQLHFERFDGFLFFLANPLFLLCVIQRPGRGITADRRRAITFHGWGLLAVSSAALLLTCMHRTMGGWQFGTRYTVDLFPYVLLWFLGRAEGWQPGAGALTLCGVAVLFNLYGAVAMLM